MHLQVSCAASLDCSNITHQSYTLSKTTEAAAHSLLPSNEASLRCNNAHEERELSFVYLKVYDIGARTLMGGTQNVM